MNDFHYNYIKKKHGSKAKLLMTDTDSFMHDIKTEDFFKDISGAVREKFDTSNFPQNHPSGILTGFNKKVLGVFKDECGGESITEFTGMRAKLYAFSKNGEESKRCKGVKKSIVSKSIHLEDYKNCLFAAKEQLQTMNIIRTRKHELFTEQVNKVPLSANDDKRIIQPDKINTLASGYRTG